MRPLVALLVLSLVAAPARAAEAPAPELATGIRQVQEGDYETAVTTLEAVARKLEGQTSRRAERAQAYLYLGIAHVALDQRDAAKAAFRAAVGLNPSLRLTEDRFSPKVIGAFEEARSEAEAAAAAAAGGGGGGGKPLLWVALGGAAAGAVVLATRGEDPQAGSVTVTNARFTEPVIVCPNGSDNLPLPFSVLVDFDNRASRQLTIQAVNTVAVITASSDVPGEVGFSSPRPSTVAPNAVAAETRATLRVESTLLCGNGPGDPARSNTWTARMSFSTSAGVLNIETTDRMRVDLP